MKKVGDFLVVSFLGVIVINFALVSAYVVITQYGSVTLYPGEKYTINIPFWGPSKAPTICGKALQVTGGPLRGVNVSVYYGGNLIGKNSTNSKGEYCITLQELTSSRKYEVFIEYDNKTSTDEDLILGSNDYTLDFEDNLVFRKSVDNYAVLRGTIENEDAEIENGRFEVKLRYYPNSTAAEDIFDYQKYFVNISSGDSYELPDDGLNVSWEIPADAKIGQYKWYVKSSFNAKERQDYDTFFNITS